MTWVDYSVIGLYVLSMIGVGWYHSRQVRSVDDYLLGGRSMSSWLIGLSLFATLTSALTYLAMPGEMVKYGPGLFFQTLSAPFAFLIVGWLVIPPIMRQRVTSGYQLLEARLGLTGRLLGSAMFVLLRIVWMATILYASVTTVVVPLLNLSNQWVPVIAVGMAVITLIYTVLGGLESVVVTDAIQALVMFAGAIAVIAVITVSLGGVSGWWPSRWPDHWQRPAFFPTGQNSRSMFGAFFSMLVWMVCTAGSDQMAIQRYLATRDAKSARASFGFQMLSTVFSFTLLGLVGLAVLGYYSSQPTALPSGWSISNDADKLTPHFIVIGLPSGVTGLVIAAILAAAMSSLSSGMNSSSAVIVTDFLGRAMNRTLSSEQSVRYARLVSVVVGVIAVSVSLYVGQLGANLLELCFKVVNLLTAPLFVLFFLALFVPSASPLAAIVATVASVSAAAVLAFGYEGQWFLLATPVALAAGVVVGTAVSLLSRKKNAARDALAD